MSKIVIQSEIQTRRVIPFVSSNILLFFCSTRGTDELLGVMDRVHIVNSTLGKALGGAAGLFLYLTFDFNMHLIC